MRTFDLAVSSWSLHAEFLNPGISGLNAYRFPEIAARVFGVRFIEFYEGDYVSDFRNPSVNESYARKIRRACDDAGVRVACFAAINDLTIPKEDDFRVDFDRLVKWADHCEILGCRILRVNSGRNRLAPADVSRFVDRVGALLRRLESHDLVLAIENHPQVLRNDHETDMLLSLLNELDSNRLGTCPDVGAMGPGYWRRGFERLSERAVHVHLKPAVLLEGGIEQGISDYGKEVLEVLRRVNYQGVASIEYVDIEELNADPYKQTSETLRDAASVFDIPLNASRMLPATPPRAPSFKVNDRVDVVPARRVLQLLANGCEHELQAQVMIHDFALGAESVYSSSAAGPSNVVPPSETGGFCTLARDEPKACEKCDKFYSDNLENIRHGRQTRSRICICPWG